MILKQLGDSKALPRSSEKMRHKLIKLYAAAIGNSSILDLYGGEVGDCLSAGRLFS